MVTFIVILPIALMLSYAILFPKTKGQLQPLEMPKKPYHESNIKKTK